MADWAKNVLQVDKSTSLERTKSFFNSLKSKGEFPDEEFDLLIDFQKIIPVITKENDPSWRDANIKAWGTKGCYYFDQEKIDDYTIKFLTAWNGVPDLMKELSRQNPDIKIIYTCDLGLGQHKDGFQEGTFIFQGGNVLMESYG